MTSSNAAASVRSVNPESQASLRDYDHSAVPVVRAEHQEDPLTRIIEQQTARIPSNVFLLLAFASMGLSLFLELRGQDRKSSFVGMWPAPLLLMGIYNKIVKTIGPM